MNTPLAGALLGAAAGAAWTLAEAGTKANAGDWLIRLGTAAKLGGAAGFWADNIARVYRQVKLKQALTGHTKASPEEIKKLVKAFRGTGVTTPVYVQTKGPAFQNAAYAEGRLFAPARISGTEWKDAVSGKTLKVDQIPEKGVYIGSGFNKLPIVAHELGHAKDLKDATFGAGTIAAVNLLALAGGIASGYMGYTALDRGNKELQAMAGALGLASIGTLVGTTAYRNKLERNASKNALEVLKRVQNQRRLDSSDSLLQKAYATYEPIQINQESFKPQVAIAAK